ncbi:F-box/FBD/LRR-repeat protein At4g26340-like [Lotus japonicus]|uniref:F-box/FBD/LRR-repeat protein At4g26340-like n=1 Tax=Lotus japonicus TaxID=34305 RepID=UPI00259012B2|nr:F-box/FBD/LRR-repeat protein At4g26340-like [Lotus japonicus]
MADRISKLPDEVLCQILSFLPTEEAVATSVLSQRWSSLWLSVPTLDFNDNRYLKGKELQSSFINFVYAIILSRCSNQPIKNFTLSVSEECPYSDLKVWLNAAMQRQVENLYLSFPGAYAPCFILTCKTLVVLNLKSVYFDGFSSVDLPSLKTLHLDLVEILNPPTLKGLVYGCPVLEDLEINDMIYVHDDGPSPEGKVQSLSKLVRAEVFLYGDISIPVEAFCNVQFLTLDRCDGDILVFPNLIYMELHLGGSISWSLALDMLNHCPKLHTVVFDLTYVDKYDVWPDPGFVPECFRSHLRKCFLKGFR